MNHKRHPVDLRGLVTCVLASTTLYGPINHAAGETRTPLGWGHGLPALSAFYPAASRRVGEQGTVVVRACVDGSGRLSSAPLVARTSGSARLDAAALRFASAASGHFIPATLNGKPVSQCTSFAVNFVLSSAQPETVTAPALAALTQKAESGDLHSELELAQLYWTGAKGIPANASEAATWLQAAANQGNASAEFHLGLLYQFGNGVEKSPAKAIRWFQKAANRDNLLAEIQLADAYSAGQGVTQNYHKAAIWFLKAARQGNSSSQCAVGNLYFNGRGVPKSYTQAIAWYEKAARQRNSQAESSLGTIYYNGNGVRKDYARAIGWYKKAAADGDVAASRSVAWMYMNADGVQQDDEEAAKWYRKAAARGDIPSENWLGHFYWAGQGVDRDYAQSFTWYSKAAEAGNAVAEDSTANFYFYGWGVPVDYQQAFYWYQKAASQGYADAQKSVGYLYWAGKGVPQDYGQAFAWFMKAAQQGNGAAEDSIGSFYYYGWSVSQDYTQATEWFQKAIASGYQPASKHLADMQTQITAVQHAQQTGSTSTEPTSSESDSAAEWQQEHQDKIDELNQEIAAHEQQAQQDDADAEQAEAQAQQNASARYSGPGSAYLNIGNAVQGSMNAGLAEKDRQEAADERRQADQEREQLAELGAEQPPVAANDSESIALTRMQTHMIRNGNTIQGALNRQGSNIQAGQQTAADQRPDVREQTDAPGGAGGIVPRGPPVGPVTVIFRGLTSPVPGQAIVTDSINRQQCPPDCSFTFQPGSYSVNFYAQADARSIFRSFEGNCVGGGGTAPQTQGNNGGCGLGNPSLATTIIVYVDPAPADAQGRAGSRPLSDRDSSDRSGYSASGTGSPDSSGGGAGCISMNQLVTGKVWLGRDGIVAGSLTNISNEPISVHYTFAKGGQPDPNQAGVLTLQPGQTRGGEMSGIEADKSQVDIPPKLFWSAVLASDADKSCATRNPW